MPIGHSESPSCPGSSQSSHNQFSRLEQISRISLSCDTKDLDNLFALPIPRLADLRLSFVLLTDLFDETATPRTTTCCATMFEGKVYTRPCRARMRVRTPSRNLSDFPEDVDSKHAQVVNDTRSLAIE